MSNETAAQLIRCIVEDDIMAEDSTICDRNTTVRRVDEGVFFIEGEIDTQALGRIVAKFPEGTR